MTVEFEKNVMDFLANYGLDCGLPPNIEDCDIERLAERILNTATLTKRFNDNYLNIFDLLVKSEYIEWNVCLRSICKFNKFDNVSSTKKLCEYLDKCFVEIQPETFVNQIAAVEKLSETLQKVFDWIIEAVQALIPHKEDWDPSDDDENENEPCIPALNTAINFLNNGLCGLFLTNSEKPPDFLRTLTEIDEHLKEYNHTEKAIELSETLLNKFKELFNPKPYVNNEYKLSHFKLKNTSFRVLTTIYTCYRILTPIEEMASVYQVYAQILDVPFKDVVFDIIHATYLQMSEEATDLPLLPRRCRIDFQWHVLPFFCLKAAKIVRVMQERYGHELEDIYLALEEVVKKLKLTMNIVDSHWNSNSLNYLLCSFTEAGLIDSNRAEDLQEIRDKQMKENPELEKMFKPPKNEQEFERNHIFCVYNEMQKVIGTICERDGNSGKKTMRRNNLAKILFSLMAKDTFSAMVSVLTAKEKLLEFTHLLAMMNMESQKVGTEYPDRLQTFDFSFLLLSWLTIKYPNIRLKVIINGDNLGSDAEKKGIFYQWARRYLKRVRRLKHKSEKNEELSRNKKENTAEGKNGETTGNVEKKAHEPVEDGSMKSEENGNGDSASTTVEEKPIVKSTEREKSTGPSESSANTAGDEQKPQVSPNAAENGEVMGEDEDDDGEVYNVPEPIPPLDMPSKEQAGFYLQKLREQQPFWNTNDPELDVVELICAIPPIGELLLENFGLKKIEKNEGIKIISDMLFVLEELSCLFVCLVQWLDMQPDSPARRSLGIAMLGALKLQISDKISKWRFIECMLEQILEEISEKVSVYPENACFAFSTTRRFCPRIGRSEYPDGVQLRSSWYYMSQQAWCGPHALRLVEHTNIAGLYTTWCDVFINRTISSRCADVAKKNLDMIFAMVMLDQYNSIIRIQESLIDYWFNDTNDGIHDARFDPISVMPVVRITTHIMMLAAWSLHELQKKQSNDGEPLAKKSTFDSPIAVPDPDDADTPAKWEFLLDTTLSITVNRFKKAYRKGVMSPVLSTICHLIRAIAGAPESEPKRLLIKRFPPEMLAEIAYIDGSALSFDVMQAFCDPHNRDHTNQKLKFLLAARRNNAI